MIKGLVDRVIFTLGVLLFMQVPHFIDQYEQRIGGYYQAQVSHLDRYQQIADKQYNGNLMELIKDYESNSRAAVQQIAHNVHGIRIQADALKKDIDVLASDSLLPKISHLIISIRFDIAQAVAKTYQPAFPLTIEAFVSGMFGGVFLSVLFNACIGFPRLFQGKNKHTKEKVPARNKRRIEPTIARSVDSLKFNAV